MKAENPLGSVRLHGQTSPNNVGANSPVGGGFGVGSSSPLRGNNGSSSSPASSPISGPGGDASSPFACPASPSRADPNSPQSSHSQSQSPITQPSPSQVPPVSPTHTAAPSSRHSSPPSDTDSCNINININSAQQLLAAQRGALLQNQSHNPSRQDTRQQQQQQQQPAAFGSIYGGGGCGVVVGGMHAASPPTSGGGGGGSPMNGNYGYPQPPPQTSGTTPNCISVPGSVGHSLISPLVRLGSNPSPIIGPPSPPSPGVVLSHSQQVQGGGFSTQHSPVEGPHVSLNTDGLPRNLSSMPHPQLQLALATAAAAPSHTSATGLTSNSPVVNSQSVPSHNTIPSARMSVSRNTNHMQANSTGIPGVLNGNQPSMPQTHQHSASPQAQPIPLTSLNNNSPLPQVVPSPTPLPTDESLLGLVNPSMLMGINPWSPGLPFVSPTQMVTQTPSGTTNPPTGVLTGMGASQTVSSGQLPPGSIGTSNLLQSTHVQQLPNQFQQINLAHGAMGMNVGVSSGNVSSTSRLLPLDGANVGVSMVPPVYQNPPGIPAQRANSGSLSPTQHSPASGNLGQQNSNSIELPPVVHSSTTTPSSAPMIQDMSIAIRDSSSLQDRYLMNMSPRQASRSRSRRRSRSSSRADIDESEEMAPPPENSLEPFGSASPALHVASQPGHKYVDITEYLTLPQADAAHKLGIPTSTLSKRWKEAVRSRKWPYRTVAKLDKEIMTLLHNIPQGASAYPLSKDVEASLGQLMRRRQDELKPVVRRL